MTAAAPSIPASLREQLSPDGGRLVIPVGDRRRQDLLLVTRRGNEWTERNDGPCVFVPLPGERCSVVWVTTPAEAARLAALDDDKLSAAIDQAKELPPIVILRLRNMTAIDATGLKAIQDVADGLRASGRTLLLCGALPQPAAIMRQAEFHRHVGAENILPSVESALARAAEVHAAIEPPLSRGA